MIEVKLQKVAYPGDPRRCQGTAAMGQCPFEAAEGQTFCERHIGQRKITQAEKKRLSLYRLDKYQQRVDELAEHDEAKSLRDEIGILRMVLESVLNQVQNPMDMILHSGKIADLLVKIEKLIMSCDRLERSNNANLDKNKAVVLGQALVEIISRYVTDADALDQIATEIVDAVIKTSTAPILPANG